MKSPNQDWGKLLCEILHLQGQEKTKIWPLRLCLTAISTDPQLNLLCIKDTKPLTKWAWLSILWTVKARSCLKQLSWTLASTEQEYQRKEPYTDTLTTKWTTSSVGPSIAKTSHMLTTLAILNSRNPKDPMQYMDMQNTGETKCMQTPEVLARQRTCASNKISWTWPVRGTDSAKISLPTSKKSKNCKKPKDSSN